MYVRGCQVLVIEKEGNKRDEKTDTKRKSTPTTNDTIS